jgi:ABC-type thiamine transport system ATPase subunit
MGFGGKAENCDGGVRGRNISTFATKRGRIPTETRGGYWRYVALSLFFVRKRPVLSLLGASPVVMLHC